MTKHIFRFSVVTCLGIPAIAIAQNTFPLDGNVGIGTNKPNAKLQIIGNLDVSDHATFGSGHWNDPIESMDYVAITTFGGLSCLGNSINTGKLTIGAWTPLAPVNGLFVGGDTLIGDRLGIGTMTPQAKLDINGDVRIGGTTLNYAGVGRIASGAEFTIQAAAGKEIHLNPFAPGNVLIGTFGGGNLQVNGTVKATTLELTSDKNQKQDFAPISRKSILRKLLDIPITTWAYTNSPSERRIGAMAQDFKAEFALGGDDKHINAGDGIGVAFAAIQGLHEIVLEKDAEIVTLKRQLASMQREIAGLNESISGRLAALEQSLQKDNVQRVEFRPETASR